MEHLVVDDGVPQGGVARCDAECVCRLIEHRILNKLFESQSCLPVCQVGARVNPDTAGLQGTDTVAVGHLQVPDVNGIVAYLGNRGLAPADKDVADTPAHETESDDAQYHLGGP